MGNALQPRATLKLTVDGVATELEVRELAWPDAMDFLEKLGTHFAKMVNESGQVLVDQRELASLIVGSRELAEFLVKRSTGKDDAWLAERTPAEVFAILDVAIPLNLNEQVINLGKKVAGRVQAALGMGAPTLPGSSTASSQKGTHSAK